MNRLVMQGRGYVKKKTQIIEAGTYVQYAHTVRTRSVHHVGGEAFNAHCDVASILR